MDEMRPKYRTLMVRNLDGKYGKLSTASCKTVGTYIHKKYDCQYYMHKTKNKRWYLEEYRPDVDASLTRELSLAEAIKWIIENSEVGIDDFKIFEELEDVSATPTPAHGGDLIVRCLACRQSERRVADSLDEREQMVLGILSRSRSPLAGKEIASLIGAKPDSAFRGMLANLVRFGWIAKSSYGGGYIVVRKLKTRKKS